MYYYSYTFTTLTIYYTFSYLLSLLFVSANSSINCFVLSAIILNLARQSKNAPFTLSFSMPKSLFKCCKEVSLIDVFSVVDAELKSMSVLLFMCRTLGLVSHFFISSACLTASVLFRLTFLTSSVLFLIINEFFPCSCCPK